MNEKISKVGLVFPVAIFVVVIAFIVSGFVGLMSPESESCWDKYATEQQAIINCEGVTND